MEAITEMTPLEVGKMYPVRCAKMRYYAKRGEYRYEYVPIYGPEHKDAQLGLDVPHYHIDGRFTSGKGSRNDYDTEHGVTNSVVCTPQSGQFEPRFCGVEIRRKKCRRLDTGIAPPLSVFERVGRYAQWYGKMLGKSCKGRRCPHLGTLMKEKNGVLVCPLHDLHGCPKTETIVAHPLQPA